MLTFPFAKINLGLRVLRRRPDGFHDIASVMLPIPLHDVLEAVVDNEVPAGEVSFERTGISIPGDPLSDLCLKAMESVQNSCDLPGLRVHLHKAIPAGAGLGGGSSDAAHMLVLLNNLLELDLSPADLHQKAASLGSDCPFFLKPEAQFAEGRGEILHPISVALGGHWLVLVAPGIHVPTPKAYSMATPSGIELDLELFQMPPASWQGQLLNDLEPAVFAMHPELAQLKKDLLDHGADYASMSGSGSTMFGIFASKPEPMNLPEGYGSWILPL